MVIYSEAEDDGLVLIKLNGKFGYMSLNGTEYWED